MLLGVGCCLFVVGCCWLVVDCSCLFGCLVGWLSVVVDCFFVWLFVLRLVLAGVLFLSLVATCRLFF